MWTYVPSPTPPPKHLLYEVSARHLSQAQDRLQKEWDLGESVRKELKANPEGDVVEKALKVTDKALKRVKNADLHSFVHDFTVRAAHSVREKNRAELYQHIYRALGTRREEAERLDLDQERDWQTIAGLAKLSCNDRRDDFKHC